MENEEAASGWLSARSADIALTYSERTSTDQLAACWEVRQVLGQSGKDLVFRAGETDMRRVNDVKEVPSTVDWWVGFPPHPGESHFESALRLAQDTGDLINSIAARVRLHEEQGS